MALVTHHTKGKVPGESCICPTVGAPRRNDCGNVIAAPHGSVVGGPDFKAGKDFKPGSKGQLQTGRGGRHGQL